MIHWKNEDDIKAELRAMTAELRRLRDGQRNLVSPPKANPSRAFLHRQSWPTAHEPPPTQRERYAPPPQADAADRPRPKHREKKKTRGPR